ncbi:MAG: hypothetical protein SVU94_04650 [Bacteroidota bacterium]|nr:hypothetical protein [Bacteroidota bacterium]
MNWTKNFLTVFVLANLTVFSFAQKGVGNNSGIAREGVQSYQVNEISGRLVEVLDEPCTETTGKYAMGTHLLIKQKVNDNEQILNIHLGPTTLVSKMVEKLVPGTDIKLKVYHADGLPDNNFVAQSFSYGDNHYELRDANLSPFWANTGTGRRKSRW